MELVRKLEPLALLLVIVGAVNWGLIGLFSTNLVADIFGTGSVTDAIYTAVGVSGLVFVPRLMDMLHISDMSHPRGTH